MTATTFTRWACMTFRQALSQESTARQLLKDLIEALDAGSSPGSTRFVSLTDALCRKYRVSKNFLHPADGMCHDELVEATESLLAALAVSPRPGTSVTIH